MFKNYMFQILQEEIEQSCRMRKAPKPRVEYWLPVNVQALQLSSNTPALIGITSNFPYWMLASLRKI